VGSETDGNDGSLIGDLVGIGKIGNEIIQAFSKATGVLYRPKAIRNEAEAKAHEIIVLADAQSKADAITRLRTDDIDFAIQQRAARRVVATAIQEQTNIENIVEAGLALAGPSSDEVPKPIDNGWFARFLDGARSVTHSELQHVWSTILARQAGEGQFSFRLLDCVKNLEIEDVRAFERFVWIKRAWTTLLTWPGFEGSPRYTSCPLLGGEDEDRLLDAGLIEHRFFLAAQSYLPDSVTVTIILMGQRYIITAPRDTISLHALDYTRIGKELQAVVAPAPSTMTSALSDKAEEFLQNLTRSAARQNLTIELAKQ